MPEKEHKYTLKELESMPTLHQGHFDDLKVETADTRVYLSRCTIADGEKYNNKVTVEKKIKGDWVIKRTYQAK